MRKTDQLSEYISILEKIFVAASPNVNIEKLIVHIRSIVVQNDCRSIKDDLLKFCLMCEKKKGSQDSDEAWKQVVKKQMNSLRAHQKIAKLVQAIDVRKAFEKILQTTSRNTSICSPRNQTSALFSLANSSMLIQDYQSPPQEEEPIDEEVRLKTLYFFKWCKYSQYCRSIKKIRLKQIDDLRKSLSFNHYAVKFSYFQNWRKWTRASIIEKERFDALTLKRKKIMFKSALEKGFYAHYQLKQMELKIQQKVLNCITQNKKKVFLNSLQDNLKRQQTKSSPCFQKISQKMTFKDSKVLKMSYMFLKHLIQQSKLQQVHSRSLKRNHQIFENTLSLAQKRIAFQSFKICVSEKSAKISQIQLFIQKLRFDFVYRSFLYKKRFMLKSKQVQKSLGLGGKYRLIKCFRAHKMFSQHLQRENDGKSQQNLSQMPKKVIKQHLDLYLNLRQQNSLEKFNLFLRGSNIKKFYRKLEDVHQSLLIRNQRLLNLNCYKIKRFISYLRNQLNHRKNIEILLENMSNRYQQNLCIKVFKVLKNTKQIKLCEELQLKRMSELLEMNLKRDAFQMLIRRSQSIRLCQLMSLKIKSFVTKVFWRKSFEQSLKVHYKVLEASQKQQNQCCRLLFNLLQANSQRAQNLQRQLKELIDCNSKKLFLQKMNKNIEFKNKKLDTEKRIINLEKEFFISELKVMVRQRQSHEHKKKVLESLSGIMLFKQKVRTQVQIRKNTKQLSLQIQIIRLRSCIGQIFENYHKKKKHTERFGFLSDQIQAMRIRQRFESLKENCLYRLQHSKASIELKLKKWRTFLCKNFWNRFVFTSKFQYLKRWVVWKQKVIAIETLWKNLQIKSNSREVHALISENKLNNTVRIWRELNISEKQIKQEKSRKLQGVIFSQRKVSIIRHLVDETKFSTKVKNISRAFKKKCIAELMKQCLVERLQNIKANCAIKHYAKSLRQKGMQSLKILIIRKSRQHLFNMTQNRFENSLKMEIRNSCSMNKRVALKQIENDVRVKEAETSNKKSALKFVKQAQCSFEKSDKGKLGKAVDRFSKKRSELAKKQINQSVHFTYT